MLSAAGDTVHVLPLVTAIKRAHPDCRITWVLQPGPATLVQGHPHVDEVLLFDRQRGWRAFRDVGRQLAERRFDAVLDLQTYLKAGILTALSRAPVRLGFDRARGKDLNWLFTNRRIAPHQPQHIQDEFLEFLQPLGVAVEPVTWELGPWPDERAWQQSWRSSIDGPIAALVVGASKPEKEWVPERWAALADALRGDYGLHPVLVGGRSPREEAAELLISAAAKTPVTSALGSGLRRLVSILDASALVISLDTGPLHMSVALERPVITLAGYSNPLRTGPWRRYGDLIVNGYGETRREGRLMTDTRTGRMPRIQLTDVLERVALWQQVYAGASRKPSKA